MLSGTGFVGVPKGGRVERGTTKRKNLPFRTVEVVNFRGANREVQV